MNFENGFGLAILILNICTLAAFYFLINLHIKAMEEHRSALAELIDLEVLK